MRVYDYDVEYLMRFYVEAFVPKLFKIFELNSAAKRYKNLLRYFKG